MNDSVTPRELLCMVCQREHQVWFAPNELWNRVVRKPDGSDEWPFLCPTCFTNIAAARGIDTAFEVRIAERGVRGVGQSEHASGPDEELAKGTPETRLAERGVRETPGEVMRADGVLVPADKVRRGQPLPYNLSDETTDTERLDWIEEHGLPDEKVHDGDSLREAIDIARESDTTRSGYDAPKSETVPGGENG